MNKYPIINEVNPILLTVFPQLYLIIESILSITTTNPHQIRSKAFNPWLDKITSLGTTEQKSTFTI